jgi:hypothetical protein
MNCSYVNWFILWGATEMKISKYSAEHYLWGDHCDGWHLVKNQDLSIIHERMPANTSEIKHYHQHSHGDRSLL